MIGWRPSSSCAASRGGDGVGVGMGSALVDNGNITHSHRAGRRPRLMLLTSDCRTQNAGATRIAAGPSAGSPPGVTSSHPAGRPVARSCAKTNVRLVSQMSGVVLTGRWRARMPRMAGRPSHSSSGTRRCPHSRGRSRRQQHRHQHACRVVLEERREASMTQGGPETRCRSLASRASMSVAASWRWATASTRLALASECSSSHASGKPTDSRWRVRGFLAPSVTAASPSTPASQRVMHTRSTVR